MNPRVGSVPRNQTHDDLKSNHIIRTHTDKVEAQAETNALAIKNFASRIHPEETSSQTIIEKTWVVIILFFTSTGASICNFFSNLFGSSSTEPVSQDVNSPLQPITKQTKNRADKVLLVHDSLKHEVLGDAAKSQQMDPRAKGISTIKSNPPLGIPNGGRNACYRNSSNQALFVFDIIAELIRKPVVRVLGESQAHFESRQSVQGALMTLLDSHHSRETANTMLDAEEILCSMIFSSGKYNDDAKLHSDFYRSENYKQLDAATYLELILGNVLNYTFVEETTNSANADGKIFSKKLPLNDAMPVMQVPILAGKNDLQSLIDAVYQPAVVHDDWEYDDDDSKDKYFFTEYTKSVKISTEPKEVIAVQLKRWDTSSGYTRINKVDLKMPADGIIDFSEAHNKEKGTHQYSVKSFIRLHGNSPNCGHYTSYVNDNGQWFHCNDSIITKVSEREAQQEMAKAYILLFGKVK